MWFLIAIRVSKHTLSFPAVPMVLWRQDDGASLPQSSLKTQNPGTPQVLVSLLETLRDLNRKMPHTIAFCLHNCFVIETLQYCNIKLTSARWYWNTLQIQGEFLDKFSAASSEASPTWQHFSYGFRAGWSSVLPPKHLRGLSQLRRNIKLRQ